MVSPLPTSNTASTVTQNIFLGPKDHIELHKLFEVDGGVVVCIPILCVTHQDGLWLQQAQHRKGAGGLRQDPNDTIHLVASGLTTTWTLKMSNQTHCFFGDLLMRYDEMWRWGSIFSSVARYRRISHSSSSTSTDLCPSEYRYGPSHAGLSAQRPLALPCDSLPSLVPPRKLNLHCPKGIHSPIGSERCPPDDWAQ